MTSSPTLRIAQNTLYLYLRMGLTMGVGLYTSRVVLHALGVSDFGIFNLVGGLVVLFSFLSNALSQATQRFLNTALGEGNRELFQQVFSASLVLYLCIALAIVVVAESVGLWWVNNRLNLPPERMVAVNWVYQCTLVMMVVGMVQLPYLSAILAHEKMSFFALISIVEVTLKLMVVFVLLFTGIDRLILYALLVTGVSLVIFWTYRRFSLHHFKACRYRSVNDAPLYRRLMHFSGWSLLGGFATAGAQQINAIWINLFFGVTVNASFGIANQVSAALNNLVTNFQVAFNPHIVKLYAAGDQPALLRQVSRAARLSFFLLLLPVVPVLLYTPLLIQWWLGVVPVEVVIFVRLTLIKMLVNTLAGPMYMTIQATGRIKHYQMVISSLLMLSIPLSYFLLRMGYPAWIVPMVFLALDLLALIVRMILLKRINPTPPWYFLRQILAPVGAVTVVALGLMVMIYPWTDQSGSFFSATLLWSLVGFTAILFVGLTQGERSSLFTFLKSRFKPAIDEGQS